MSQSINPDRKHCDQKKDKAANKDKTSHAWQVVSTKTGKALLHIKVEGKNVEYLGYKWSSLSAFKWVPATANGITQFNEHAAKDMARLYKLQTGNAEVKVVKIMVA